MAGSADATAPRRAGQYAYERYSRALRSFRRRLYRQVVWALVLLTLVELGIAVFVDTTLGWMGFAFVLGAFLGVALLVRELPPDHVRRWGDGAWGEQQTAKALQPLERERWSVRHDVELKRGNIDHVVESPRGRAFVLETKALQGRVTVEDGVLTTTQVDDPEQVYEGGRLRHVVLERARHVYRERNGRGGWVQAAIVVWGDFPQRRVEAGKLVFLHGEELVRWLRERNA